MTHFAKGSACRTERHVESVPSESIQTVTAITRYDILERKAREAGLHSRNPLDELVHMTDQ